MAELGQLERLYGVLPAGAQSAIFSAWGVRTRWQRLGGEFRTFLAELERSDFDDAETIALKERESLARMVRHAFTSVPYYRALAARERIAWQEITSRETLDELPVLRKDAVRAMPDEFLSDRCDPRQLLSTRTSGTTGSPLVVRHTRRALRFQWAIWWRHKARFGVHPGDSFLTFGARVPVLGRSASRPWRENLAQRQTYLVASLLAGRTLEAAIEMVRQRRFTFFTGYPSAMYVLARALLDRQVRLDHPPRMIFTGSDALTPGFRHVIEEAFGARVSDNFGSAEMCGNLSQCPEGRYHVDHELGLVELLPASRQEPGLRRIVCTGFVNDAMPLVRYELGDLARVADGRCSCGRSTPTVTAVEGRTEDLIRTRDGRVVSGLNQVLEWVPGISEAQVRQDELDAVDVLLVTREPITTAQITILRREFAKRAGERLEVRVHRVDAIPRMPNGKFRAVVSTLPPASEVERRLLKAVEARADRLTPTK